MLMRGGSRCIYIVAILMLPFFVLSSPLASGIMGYDINARVDSSVWSLHRSTTNLTFICDDNVSGSGKFSRLSNLQDLAGHAKDESSYSLNGSLEYIEKVRFLINEGKVIIKADINEYEIPFDADASQDSESGGINITNNSANIIVDEQWPSSFIDYKSMKYSGSGIRTKDIYCNNGDEVSTSFYSTELQKESLYRAAVNRTMISAQITPEAVKEDRNMNKTSIFILNSFSEGPSVNLEFSRSMPYSESGRFGRMTPNVLISEDYSGSQLIRLKVGMNESVLSPSDDGLQWLPCCSEANQSFSDEHLDAQDIFDCSCFKRV